jgi:Domain of unknown function (DUF4419)
MRHSIVVILMIVFVKGQTQNSTTFDIEKLSKPKGYVYQSTPKEIFKYANANIEKHSNLPDSLVSFHEHSFLEGALTAYKEHRPFTISPDIIWLLISQGFARHITNNAELFRKDLVSFNGKKTLTIITSEIALGNTNSNWEALFPQFVNQISHFTGSELTDVLTANFTTTTPTAKIVSEITVMETMKAYFDYKVILSGCGLPKITIEGTVEDWEKVLKKTQYISKFQLEWWTSELEPILKEIIEAKKGNFKKSFWMNMIKFHTGKKYGSPTTIDGWIVKFYPYTKKGDRTGLKPINNVGNLASEIVKVPFVLEDLPNKKNYKMEFWAGFIGLSQNKSDFTLKPEIGWAINNVSVFNPENSQFRYSKKMEDLTISNVDSVPEDVLQLEQIDFLTLNFIDEIHIPDSMKHILIAKLDLNGKVSKEEEERIIKLFPSVLLKINGIKK